MTFTGGAYGNGNYCRASAGGLLLVVRWQLVCYRVLNVKGDGQMTNHYAMKVAMQTEKEWFDELTRLHGRDAGDVRYKEIAHGEEGSKLRQLYLDYRNARDYWLSTLEHTTHVYP